MVALTPLCLKFGRTSHAPTPHPSAAKRHTFALRSRGRAAKPQGAATEESLEVLSDQGGPEAPRSVREWRRAEKETTRGVVGLELIPAL